MRKQLKIAHSETMFGHTYTYQLPDQSDTITVLENHAEAWHLNQKRVSKPFYWFRAPRINNSQLTTTLQNLADLGAPYELKVWHSEKGLDASLKVTDEMDAATWAWSHTDIWSKWSDSEEKSWVAEQKPRKLKVNKDGSIKVRVTVSEIPNP